MNQLFEQGTFGLGKRKAAAASTLSGKSSTSEPMAYLSRQST
jgi:hypothetical protein